MSHTDTSNVKHTGGCHCGQVRFQFEAPASADILTCNCSMCTKLGYLHLFVSRDCFKLLTPEDALNCYTFNTGVAKHYFCKSCGVKSFYIPRSHPDKYSINVNCIDPGTFTPGETISFDGRNWEQAKQNLT